MNSNHTITARSVRRDLEKRGKITARKPRVLPADFHPTKGWRNRHRDQKKAPVGFAITVKNLINNVFYRSKVPT